MFRHVSSQVKPAPVLDFLAPSFFSFSHTSRRRLYTTGPTAPEPQPKIIPKKLPFPLQASTTSILLARLKNNVASLKYPSGPLRAHRLSPEKVQFFNKTIHQIRRSLDRGDTASTLRHWQSLDERRLIHLLNRAQLAPLSTLMIRSFLTPGEDRKIEPHIRKLVENIALLAAKADSLDALNALMKRYIKQKKPQAVLDLYAKFMTLIGNRDSVMETNLDGLSEYQVERGEKVGEIKEDLATDTKLKSTRAGVIPGRTQLLLAAITAHAMKDSFRDAMMLYQSTAVRLRSSGAVFDTAFGLDVELWEKVREYVFRLNIADLVSQPGKFASQMARFGNARAVETLENFYKRLMEGLSGRDPFLAADPSLVTDTKTVAMTSVCWSSLLSAFMKCNRKDMASKLWDDMTGLGLPPGIPMWTTLIDAYEGTHAADDALNAWNMMLSQGIQPDALAYRAIIAALFKGHRPDHALEMFRKYREIPTALSSPYHINVCNTVLNGLCTTDRASQAEALREELQRSGVKLDLISYNTFISYYGRRGQFKAVATVLRAMKDAGVEGDVFTYTTILSSLLKAGRTDASELVLELMDKQGVKRNVVLYTTLITHQLREGDRGNFRAGMQMLQKMEQDPENLPNEITYTSVLTAIHRLPWMTPEELEQWRTDIVGRIRRRGLVMGLPTYHLLLKSCLVYPYKNGVKQALAYFDEMKQQGIPIIQITWYILLAGLLARSDWATADKFVGEMYASGIHPSGSLLRLVHKINDRTAEDSRNLITI